MELSWLVQHHLDGVLLLVELVTFVSLAATRSPRASLDGGHLLQAIPVVMALVFPLDVAIAVVVPALAGSRLGLSYSWLGLSKLHPYCGVSCCILVRYRHEFSHGLGLGPVELVLHQRSIPAAIGEVFDGLLLTYSFARVAQF
jgi:hypothetical protein